MSKDDPARRRLMLAMKIKSLMLTHPAALLAAVLIALSAAGAAAVPVFKATEKPAFCITCHEMRPYYDAWQTGAHKTVDCVACHVDPGTVNHLKHKATATKELVDHFSTKPTFPRGDAVVPDARCLVCHKDILSRTGPKFSHKQHAGTAPCAECHRDAGHRVSTDALSRAGVLATSSAPTSETTTTALLATMTSRGAAATRSTVATSALHVALPQCTRCHDLDKQTCESCHTPPHKVLPGTGGCTTCHRPGIKWVFTHPADPACATCHKPPANHFPGECSTCHHAPGVSFKNASYGHTDPACSICHTAPAKHRDGQCATCHRSAGRTWAFTHPTTVQCSTCHAAPAGHYGANCSSCHKVGVPFKNARVAHNLSLDCARCHARPGGHRAGQCSTCHRNAGSNWAFTHTTSSGCSSCHSSPASHYGATCASCHSPSRAWASATFSHPSVHHGYTAWACVKCHPNGYASHSCTTCHGAQGGGD